MISICLYGFTKLFFDSIRDTLRLLMYLSEVAKTPDTLLATLSGRTANAMRLRATGQRETLYMRLARSR